MTILTALLAWLGSYAGGIVVKLLVDGLLAWMAQQTADSNAKALGASQVKNQISVNTVETQDAMDAVPRPTDDAVADSLRSGKF